MPARVSANGMVRATGPNWGGATETEFGSPIKQRSGRKRKVKWDPWNNPAYKRQQQDQAAAPNRVIPRTKENPLGLNFTISKPTRQVTAEEAGKLQEALETFDKRKRELDAVCDMNDRMQAVDRWLVKNLNIRGQSSGDPLFGATELPNVSVQQSIHMDNFQDEGESFGYFRAPSETGCMGYEPSLPAFLDRSLAPSPSPSEVYGTTAAGTWRPAVWTPEQEQDYERSELKPDVHRFVNLMVEEYPHALKNVGLMPSLLLQKAGKVLRSEGMPQRLGLRMTLEAEVHRFVVGMAAMYPFTARFNAEAMPVIMARKAEKVLRNKVKSLRIRTKEELEAEAEAFRHAMEPTVLSPCSEIPPEYLRGMTLPVVW
ncbi:MAG: hypothetical protein LQ340_005530 [Diploschistes diacapsis]|nr:MAG: hypothetical protein LQ340_005530 [Diploschistes diacapsis]